MPSIAQVIGPVLVLVTLLKCPESPRVRHVKVIPYLTTDQRMISQWLISKGRVDEASRVLCKYHANGAADDALVQWELAEIQATLEYEDSHHYKSYLDFLRSSGNRRRLCVLLSLCIGQNWVGNGVIS